MSKVLRTLIISLLSFVIGIVPMTGFSSELTFYTHSSEEQIFFDRDQIRGVPHAGKRAFQIELIREMMLIRGVKANIVDVPFSRGFAMVQAENNIAFFSLARTDGREQKVKWGNPLKTTKLYFYDLKKSPTQITSIDDAKKVFSIGVVRGSIQESTLVSLGFENYYPINSYAQVLSMLELGRLSLIVGSADFTEHPESKRNQLDVNNTNVELTQYQTYLAFSKDVDDIEVEKWQQAYHEIETSGRLNALRNEYLLPSKLRNVAPIKR